MPLKLVPHKLASLGAGFGVCDVACAPEYGPVKGERACSLDKLRLQVRNRFGVDVFRGHPHAPGSALGQFEISGRSRMSEGTATGPEENASITSESRKEFK
jgi:hypothetical protein